MILPKAVFALPTAKTTLLVTDEQGEPLVGVEARLGFRKPKSNGSGSTSYGIEGITDEEGIYTGEGATENIMFYGSSADGYYNSSFQYRGFTGVSGILGFRKWQPWNPTLKVVLREIKKPIAMYAYHTDWIDIPKNGEFVGYDLIKRDWVSPYGKGINSDFLFRLDKDIRSYQDYDSALILKFPNEADGIQSILVGKEQGSDLKLAYKAPVDGYSNLLEQSESGRKDQVLQVLFKEEQNYYFRIRSYGDTEKALYGKIHGNIQYGRISSGKGAIRFTYYLNPTPGDTNVEFDPRQNLFTEFKFGRSVSEP